MRKAIFYYRPKKGDPILKTIIEISDDVNVFSDSFDDHCHDIISEKIGHSPRWIRFEGLE